MSGEGLLDTSVVILLDRLTDPAVLPAVPRLASVTLAELSVGPLATDDPGEAAIRQLRLQRVEATFEPIPFDRAAAQAYGGVVASLRRNGRHVRARAMDALLAATALANDLPIHTVNPRDFEGIDGLEVRAVVHPDAG